MKVFFFFFTRPSDRPTITRDGAMGNETFYWDGLVIGHLHDGVSLLLRIEFFSFFLSHLNLVIPGRFNTKAIICTRKEKPEGFWS